MKETVERNRALTAGPKWNLQKDSFGYTFHENV